MNYIITKKKYVQTSSRSSKLDISGLYILSLKHTNIQSYVFNISIYKNIFGSCIKGDSSSFLNSSFPLSSIGYLPYLPLLHSFCSSALLSLPFIVFHQCFFPPLSSPASSYPPILFFYDLFIFSFPLFLFLTSLLLLNPRFVCGHSGKHKNTQSYAWAWSPEHLSNKPHIQYWCSHTDNPAVHWFSFQLHVWKGFPWETFPPGNAMQGLCIGHSKKHLFSCLKKNGRG